MPPTTPPDGFRCDVIPDRDRVVVRPVGEIDLATVPFVEEPLAELEAAGFTELILDLRRTTFLDSTGVRLLVRQTESARRNGHDFGVVAEDGPVMRVLELTGLKGRIPFTRGRAIA
jgi:anti-sigma B factor antagonist